MTPKRRWLLLAIVALTLATPSHVSTASSRGPQDAPSQSISDRLRARLLPTAHPAVPATLDSMWYAPAPGGKPAPAHLAALARGVRLLEETDDAASALPLVSAPVLAKTDVAPYAKHYEGIALHRLGKLPEAEAAFAIAANDDRPGHLAEAAAMRQAAIREARGDDAGALGIYERLAAGRPSQPSIVWLKLAAAAEAVDRARALETYRKVLRDFAITPEAGEAELALERLNAFPIDTTEQVAAELARAEALFKARRWGSAQNAFARVTGKVSGADRDLVAMRTAQLDAQSGKHRAAREVFLRFQGHPMHGEEAQFYLLGSTLALGDKTEYRRLAHTFVERHPKSPRADEALDALATHYVRENDDPRANEVFVQILERYPAGRFAERAAWKAGWWAYRHDDYRNTIKYFEQGAAQFPRSDYRPAWLYWSARAYDALGEKEAATERFKLAVTDYLNTYYGRLSWKHLEERNETEVSPGTRAVVASPPPPANVDRIRRLIELELYHPALAELLHAQRVYGDSPQLQATIALVHNRLGNLRPAINTMKRAYPQYMTAGGEQLPVEILRVIFPLDHWGLIQGFAKARGLDPFLVAALIGQESTFDAGIRSPVNAIGLMQVMPATGRQYARKLGIANFTERSLTNPEINARIGTQYLSELIARFNGGLHLAIASYNAGEHRVERWKAEKPDLPQDEFIDDIPFPETQNYVKRILGTAEDYRRLYGNRANVRTVTARVTETPVPARTAKPTPKKTSKATPKKSTPKKTAKKPARKSSRR